jgi:hypothetical protein
VDKEWNFAVLNLTDEFLRELLGPDLTGAMTPVQLMIRRPEQGGKFVTKVRLAQIKRDQKLGIANILLDWQQTEVQPGDIVFF